MQVPAPLAPLGTRVWLQRSGDGVPADPRFSGTAVSAWPAFEEAVAGGGSLTLVMDDEVLRTLVARALGIDPAASSSLVVAPGQGVLLEVGKLGWMLVHSNARIPEDA